MSLGVLCAAQLNEFGWTADGSRFLSTTGLGTVEVLAYPSMELLHDIQAHTSPVYALAFRPPGEARRRATVPYAVQRMLCTLTLPCRVCWMYCTSWVLRGCAMRLGTWHPLCGRRSVLPMCRYFAIGSADAIVSLWDLAEMLCIRTFPNLG